MIIFSNINKYFGDRAALQDINLIFNDGEFVSIIGGNGAGKSTLLNILDRSIEPDSGKISIYPVNGQSNNGCLCSIGRVYQDANFGTAPGMTIQENFTMSLLRGKKPSLRKGITVSKVEKITNILLSVREELRNNLINGEYQNYSDYFQKLDFENRLNTKMESLSGGERQYLSVLMVLMMNPGILLLDEHVASLDPIMGEIVMALTVNLVEKLKSTTLMVTHNIDYALKFGDRLIMLDQGKVVLDFSGKDKKQLTTGYLIEKFGYSKTKLH